jgi:hypothetical protein
MLRRGVAALLPGYQWADSWATRPHKAGVAGRGFRDYAEKT